MWWKTYLNKHSTTRFHRAQQCQLAHLRLLQRRVCVEVVDFFVYERVNNEYRLDFERNLIFIARVHVNWWLNDRINFIVHVHVQLRVYIQDHTKAIRVSIKC